MTSPLHASVPAGLGSTKPDGHARLMTWIQDCIALCEPDQVFYCDGSAAEKDFLTREALRMGVLIELNQQKLPG